MVLTEIQGKTHLGKSLLPGVETPDVTAALSRVTSSVFKFGVPLKTLVLNAANYVRMLTLQTYCRYVVQLLV